MIWKKLRHPRIWRRLYLERLGEPLLYNVASLFVALFGSVRKKIEYDLVVRQPYAYCVQQAADLALKHGVPKIAILEFGVANGAGLMNLCSIAEQVSRESGIQFEIVGFDSGAGMPPPRDYRDHPEKYFTGDFPLTNRERLLERLPKNARILFGELPDSIARFRQECGVPIGAVSIDVDYYWSAREALEVLLLEARNYLPYVFTYFDDVHAIDHNEFCGELLAIKEFNADALHPERRIAPANFLTESRLFKRPIWHRQIYLAHVFDHEFRSIEYVRSQRKAVAVLSNPYD